MSLLRGALRGVHPARINVAPSLYVESALCVSQLSGSVCGALRVRPVRCREGRATCTGVRADSRVRFCALRVAPARTGCTHICCTLVLCDRARSRRPLCARALALTLTSHTCPPADVARESLLNLKPQFAHYSPASRTSCLVTVTQWTLCPRELVTDTPL